MPLINPAAGTAARDFSIVLLSVLYPTVFTLSNNWYFLDRARIAALLLLVPVAAAVVYALAVLLSLAAGRVCAWFGRGAQNAWRMTGQPVLLALLCISLLYTLLQGTLEAAFGGVVFSLAFAAVCLAGTVRLLIGGRYRFFAGLLLLLTVVSTASWTASYVEFRFRAAAAVARLPGTGDFAAIRLAERPNIFLLIYDAYGSDEAYRRVFDFDNSAQYAALADRGFTVAHTFSNYHATWPTTLSLFLGAHQGYQLIDGVDDTKIGRAIMSGRAPNPVLQALQENGYRIQYIHGFEYFVSERGALDYVYPAPSFAGALRIFQGPLLTRLAEAAGSHGGRRALREQDRVLQSRLPPPAGKQGPWFTFAHVNLPGHGPKKSDWTELESFEKTFRRNTRAANRHMNATVDAIRARDPGAVIVILGDHGAWRYRKAWSLDPDPNRSFEMAGVDTALVTLDLFGIMIAVHSAGRCDSSIYPAITPVNVMRTVFACLAGDNAVAAHAAEDVSLFGGRTNFVTQRDGRILPRWEPVPRD